MLKEVFSSAYLFLRKNVSVFFLFWLLLLCLDLIAYFTQINYGLTEETSHYLEMGYQVFLVFYSVCLLHLMNSLKESRNLSIFKLIGESLLLTPGFILQTIFFLIAAILGTVLLVVPGVYIVFAFYFSPILAVIYPDYQGKIFFLSRELFHLKWKEGVVIILVTTLVPLIPDGIIWLMTGALKSSLTPFFAPIEGALFIGSELVAFCFLYPLVKEHRLALSKKAEEKSKLEVEPK